MRGRLAALARSLRSELRFYRLVLAHERTPWLARALVGGAIGYALSPIDLVPDWVPLLGQLDDLVIVPALVVLGMKLVPRDVIEECRHAARG